MKVLYVGLKHDYGDPSRGLDYGYYNTFESLREMADEITLADVGVVVRGLGRRRFDRGLREAAAATRPDVVFCGLFRDEVTPATLRHLRDELGLPVVAWFADDQWRFRSHTARYAASVSWAITTSPEALPMYREIGASNVLASQWACNPFRYKPVPAALEHDVSFVGQPHGDRRQAIDHLAASGFRVDAYGQGWLNGRIGQDEMVRLFSASRINLNLANASTSPFADGSLLSRTASRLAGLRMPTGLRSAGRRLLRAIGPRRPPASSPLPQQIKGRNFEIPACGGFVLTSRVQHLEQYYRIGHEVACYDGLPDLVDQVRAYLSDEEERARVALAGHQRTLKEHTWFHRFEAIFRAMSVQTPSARDILARGPRPAPLVEVFP